MNDVLLAMLSNYGLKEVIGPDSNPEILEMFKAIGYGWVNDDETAWCSASLNYFCLKTGYERSNKLDARSWLKLPLHILKPSLGDIVVLWRENPNSWKGHVGLFISQNANYTYILGGNQENMIGINPFLNTRILGYRRSKKIN